MTNPEEFPRNLMEDIDTESIEETERRKKIWEKEIGEIYAIETPNKRKRITIIRVDSINSEKLNIISPGLEKSDDENTQNIWIQQLTNDWDKSIQWLSKGIKFITKNSI
jgi:hypothetical protein